jgi:hypothetical protein
VHDDAPAVLNEPAGQIASTGVEEFDAGGQAYPALQLKHGVPLPELNVPAGQGWPLFEPDAGKQ